MDRAHSQPFSTDEQHTQVRPSSSPTLPNLPLSTTTSPEPSPSRQRRLLQGRNARFPAKKLSLSNLGSRISHLIHANDETPLNTIFADNQENTSPARQLDLSVNKSDILRTSSGILDEISNTKRGRRGRKSADVPVYQDTPERPLLDRSPYSSPAVYQDLSSEGLSPLGFETTHESTGSMRLREISGNEHRVSPFTNLSFNGSVKGPKKRKSIQIKAGFDTQEYIDHIERELQEAKNEMFSPTTNRSLKDQLRSARHDNDRLRQEMAELREGFESELKRTLEIKTSLEVECKRKVRDLEEELEQKTLLVKDLELQHDEKRLDNGTIDTLKATIEKLELDKVVLEDENRSVSKRNEVLSELLAMSPTKTQQFELRSPVREKRPGRPMSMIIPRAPLSPSRRQASQPPSAVVSPSLSAKAPFFTHLDTAAGVEKVHDRIEDLQRGERGELPLLDTNPSDVRSVSSDSAGPRSRGSTLQSQSSSSPSLWAQRRDSSPHDELSQRLLPKRKPRRFMAGSTQLKPLLLPALAGDTVSQPSSSVVSSPRIIAARSFSHESIDPTTCFLSQPEDQSLSLNSLATSDGDLQDMTRNSSKDTIIAYQTFDEILAEQNLEAASENSSNDTRVMPDDQSYRTSKSGEDDSHSQWTTQISNLTHPKFDTSTKYASSIDADVLERLHLPEPQYNVLPFTPFEDDDKDFSDLPRPLFSASVAAHRSTGMVHRGRASLDYEEARRRLNSSYSDGSRCSNFGTESNMAAHPKKMRTHRLSSPATLYRQTWTHSASRNSSSDRSELPQRSTLKSRPRPTDSLVRTRGLLDVLRHGKFGARPLASLTIRTMFRTISQCATYMKDLKRDPLALARRVIANAWFSNWSRLGRLSWWVLGLFITPTVGGPKLRTWNWDQYDGEAIAHRFCPDGSHAVDHWKLGLRPALPAPSRYQYCDTDVSDDVEHGPQAASRKFGWGRSIMLWGKFSFAIMLAVGGAVVKGPGEMLKDLEDRKTQNDQGSIRVRTQQQRVNHHQSSSEVSFFRGPPSDWKSLRERHSYADTSRPCTQTRQGSNFHYGSAESQHLIRHANEDALCQLQDENAGIDEDDTLRPPRSPRPHVANLFYDDDLGITGESSVLPENLRQRRHRSSQSQTSSINDGFLRWPPSPGPIHPTDILLSKSRFHRPD